MIDEIVSIEYCGDVDTVDISVSGDNLFYANGILTHNSAYNTTPGMEDVAESMGIVNTADVILSIFQNEEDMELGIIRLGMMKNRFGMRGMVQPMRIQYDTLTVVQGDDEMEIIDDDGEDDISFLEKLAG